MRRKMTLLFVTALALGIVASGAWASSSGYSGGVYQWDNNTPLAAFGSTGNSGFANVWTIGSETWDNQIKTVDVYFGTTSAAKIDVKAWDVTGGVINMAPTKTLADQGVSVDANGWAHYAVNWTLDKGKTYAIGFQEKTNYAGAWMDTSTVTPAEGNPSWQMFGAQWINLGTQQPRNFMIRATTAPEPASLVLLGCAAGAGAWVRRRKTNRTK